MSKFIITIYYCSCGIDNCFRNKEENKCFATFYDSELCLRFLNQWIRSKYF